MADHDEISRARTALSTSVSASAPATDGRVLHAVHQLICGSTRRSSRP